MRQRERRSRFRSWSGTPAALQHHRKVPFRAPFGLIFVANVFFGPCGAFCATLFFSVFPALGRISAPAAAWNPHTNAVARGFRRAGDKARHNPYTVTKPLIISIQQTMIEGMQSKIGCEARRAVVVWPRRVVFSAATMLHSRVLVGRLQCGLHGCQRSHEGSPQFFKVS